MMHSLGLAKKPFTVADDTDTPAICRAYAYLSQRNPLWLANLPGVSLQVVQQARSSQLAGQSWWELLPSSIGGKEWQKKKFKN